MLSIGGIICNFTPSLPYIGGINLDHDFVQLSKLSENQKKKVFTENGTLFSPNSSGHLRSDAHQRPIIEGDADVDHTQTIGGDTVKLLGKIYPPIPPRVSAPLHLTLSNKTKRYKTYFG